VAVVVLRGGFALEDVPAPQVHLVGEGQEGDLVQGGGKQVVDDALFLGLLAFRGGGI